MPIETTSETTYAPTSEDTPFTITSGTSDISSVVDTDCASRRTVPYEIHDGTRSPSKRAGHSEKSMPKASVRQTMRVLIRVCEQSLERLIDNADDPILRSNSFGQLKNRLHDLWDLRSEWDQPYAELVNMLEGLVSHRTAESFSIEQLETLRAVMWRIEATDDVDDQFNDAITMELIQGGLDVFREIE